MSPDRRKRSNYKALASDSTMKVLHKNCHLGVTRATMNGRINMKDICLYISEMDEVLKDADAMHHIYNDLSKEVKEKEAARYSDLKKEFGIES